MVVLELGLPTKSIIFWILQLFPLFSFARNTCLNTLKKGLNTKEITYISLTLLLFFGEILAGIISFIKMINSRKNAKKVVPMEKKFSNSAITVIPARSHTNMIITSLLILLLSLLDGFYMFYLSNLSQVDSNSYWYHLRTIELIWCGIFCKFILHYNYFRHHYVSLGLILLGVLIMIIFPFNNIIKWENLHIIIQLSFFYFFWGLQDCIEKWLMDVAFIEPETILFFQGTIGIIIILIIGWIEYQFDILFWDIKLFETLGLMFQTAEQIMLVIGIILLTFIYNYLILLIVKLYSPTQKTISDLIVSFFIVIYEQVHQNNINEEYWISLGIGFFLTLIGCLIYDEIIIVHLCDLNMFVKENIRNRADKDYKQYEQLIRVETMF